MRKRVDYDKIVGLFEFNRGVPRLVRWELLSPLFDEASIEPELECQGLKVEFHTYYSWGGSPK